MRKLWILLLVLLSLWGVTTAALFLQRADRVQRSAAGVVLSLGEGEQPLAVGDLSEPEMTDKVGQLARLLSQSPIQPSIDPITKGVVPGLAGWELDVAATVATAMAAEPGSLVQPVMYAVQPESIWDFAVHQIYQGNPAKQQISLVINVAWGNENLPAMLDILAEHEVKASFFLVGRWVAQNADLVQQIAAAGHEFGNHAYSDPHLPQLDRTAIATEIERTSEAIESITGQPVRFFSPPYNDFNQTVLDTAADLGYLTVLCSLDTADWMRPGVDRIVARIVPRAHTGAIVLMHPTEQTPAALRLIVTGLQEQGYELVPVGELLSPVPGESILNLSE